VREIRAGDTVWIAPEKSIGMALVPTPTWCTLPCRRVSTTRMSRGWKHVTDEQYNAKLGG
jgi:hypothetical protein